MYHDVCEEYDKRIRVESGYAQTEAFHAKQTWKREFCKKLVDLLGDEFESGLADYRNRDGR